MPKLFTVMIAAVAIMLTLCSTASAIDLDVAKDREEAAMQQSGGIVTRRDKQLHVRLTNGTMLVLANNDALDTPNDSFIVYFYKGMLADNQFFVVDVHYYETTTTLLIGVNDGKQYNIINKPHLSPDGKFIVTTSASENSAAGVFLWEIQHGKLTERLRYEPTGDESALFDFERWTGPHSADIVKLTLCTHRRLGKISVHLTEKNGTWELTQAPKTQMECL